MKVRIPKDIAESIEYVRQYTDDTNVLLMQIFHKDAYVLFDLDNDEEYEALNEHADKLFEFATNNAEIYTKAVLFGYEIEETPEEKIREMYMIRLKYSFDPDYDEGYIRGIIDTLNALNIKIEGVNIE